MRFAVLGPGALGCLMAAKLAEAVTTFGDSLWVLDHNRERAEAIQHQGIIYEKFDKKKQYPIKACADPAVISRVDVLFLCVKSYDLKSALDFCRPLLASGTLIVFMQNGIAHLELQNQVGAAVPVYGCTSEGATYLGVGHTRHAGEGTTFLGCLGNPDMGAGRQMLDRAVSRLRTGGLSVSLSDTILVRLWAKLFINVGINALTAIHDCRNGDLLSLPEAVTEMRAAVSEAEHVAITKGIIVENDPYQTTINVCRSTAANISSMRQDVLKKKRTEIDAINGAVVREAELLGLSAPVNASIVKRMQEIEQGYAGQRAGA